MAVKVREWTSLDDIQDFIDDLGLREGSSAFVAAAEVEVPPTDEAATEKAVAAAAVTTKNSSRPQKPPRPCPVCGGDHWMRECSKRKEDTRRCFRCERVGHIARNCTAPPRTDKEDDTKKTKDKKKAKRRSRRRSSCSSSSSSESSGDESRHRSSRRARSKRRGKKQKKKKHRHKRSLSSSSSSSSESGRSRSRSRGNDKGARSKPRSDAPHAAIGCMARAKDVGDADVTAPLVRVTVGGVSFVAMLDTGAEVSLVASRVVSLKDGPNLSRFQMVTPVVVAGVWQESTRLTTWRAAGGVDARREHASSVLRGAGCYPVAARCGFSVWVRFHEAPRGVSIVASARAAVGTLACDGGAPAGPSEGGCGVRRPSGVCDDDGPLVRRGV